MPKKIDKEKEQKFIDFYCEGETAGNATQSAIKAGWENNKSIRFQARYLKNKYKEEIRKKQEERISSISGPAITVLQQLLDSEQDAVKLNTAKLILELGNFSSQTINVNVDKTKDKTDAELIAELKTLMETAPDLAEGVPLVVVDKQESKSKH